MNARGFTLIELMVAVTIFAIISAVAIPQYTAYSQRGYRTEAQSDLLLCAQGLEQFSAINFTYVGANPGGDDTALDTNVCDPLSVRQGRYTITAVTTATTYQLTAVGANAMADDGDMTINEIGRRQWDEGNDITFGANDNDWNEG